MSVIWASFRKEVSEVLRDKRTLILAIVVPMIFYPALIMLAGGLGAKQQVKENARTVKVGVVDHSTRYDFMMLLDDLQSKDSNLQWLNPSIDDIEKSLGAGEFDVVAEFDHGAENDIEEPYYQVTLHYFSTARGEVDLNRVKRALNKVKADIVENVMGNVIKVDSLQDYASVRESAGSKYGGMGAYFLVFLAFTGCMAVAVDVAAGEKERGTLEAMLITPASFWEISIGKLIFVMIMGLLSVKATAIGIGSMVLLVGNSMEDFSLGGVSTLSLMGIALLIVVMVFFFAVVLFSLSIVAKSSKEAHMRASMMMLVLAMSLVYCTLPGVELTRAMLFIPVLNVALTLRALWEGTLSFGEYALVIGSLLVLSALILSVISRKVKRDAERVLLK